MTRNGAVFVAAILLAGMAAKACAQTLAERAQACLACHGEDGDSKTPLVPSLAGQPSFFLTTQMVLIRETVRPVAAMQGLLTGLDDETIAGLADHFAKMPAKKSDEAGDATLAARGRDLASAMRCASCHGAELQGQEQMPRLAGQRIDYMVEAMKSFRDSTRPGADPLMSNVVAGVADADLLALAHYAAAR